MSVASTARRLVLLAAAATAGGVWLAGPAAAHVEVTGKPAQAGARNAVVTFTAESESPTAGITGLKVQLPAGIAPADVSLVSGPAGWRLAATADGYTVSGPAIPAGRDAQYAIRVAQLPAARSVAFKTLQNYANGAQDEWIELPTAGDAEPKNPAPILDLAPAPATTPAPTTSASTSSAPSSTAPTTTTATPSTSAAQPSTTEVASDSSDGGSGPGWWIAAAVALAVVVGAVLAWRQARARRTPPPA